jgi:hypothetical protein
MERAKYIFSRTKNEVLFANNFDKFGFVAIALALVIYILFVDSNSLNIIFITLILVTPCLIMFVTHFKKAAYKLVFDLKEGKVEFSMFRKGGVVVRELKSIQKVQDGGYITFYLEGGKKIIWKKRANEEELLNLLNKVTIVETKGLF